jgi:hypothetical protein
MQPTISPATQAILDRMASQLHPMFRQSVTPISFIHHDQTIQLGTGTFFRIADESFLVTAAHVYDSAERQGFHEGLHVFDLTGHGEGAAQIRPVAITGRVHRALEPWDVAVFQLDDEVALALPGRRFLRLNEVSLRPHPHGRCWIYGFPAETTKQELSTSEFRFDHFSMLAPFYEGDKSVLQDFNPQVHFLLDAARDDIARSDGSPATLPSRLNGISGCSIWQPEWPLVGTAADWTPERTKIVGVQTGHYTGRSIIKATSWGAVAAVIHRCRPDLRSIIDMHLGPAR